MGVGVVSEMPSAEKDAPCGACGEPSIHRIILYGQRVPVCLRHLNVWVTPGVDYTCPTACVEQNHPGREHHNWLTGHVPAPPTAIGGSTGLVYCKACGSLLYGDRCGRTAAMLRPCKPVRIGPRTNVRPPAVGDDA